MKASSLVAFLLVAGAAQADYTPTAVSWGQWRITTSEDLAYRKLDRRYTLMNLLDEDPKTTWILNRTGKIHWLRKEVWNDRDGFTFEGPNISIDGVRIMNGYNKSERLYKLNDRVSKLVIYAGDKRLKSVELSDRLGWHVISLPKTTASNLSFEIAGIRKGKIHDLCLSGLQLLYKGRVVKWHIDRTVFFNAGGESEPNDTELWTATGKLVATDRGNNLEGPMVSPSGRYVVGTDCPGRFISLWVVDVNLGKIIHRRRMFDEPHPSYPHIYHADGTWRNERTLDVRFEVQEGKPEYVVRRVRF